MLALTKLAFLKTPSARALAISSSLAISSIELCCRHAGCWPCQGRKKKGRQVKKAVAISRGGGGGVILGI